MAIKDAAQIAAEEFLANRQMAYVQVFDKESLFVKTILEDLGRFCRANESCFHSDPRLHAALEGRREVWLRIQNHINLTTEDLIKRYERK